MPRRARQGTEVFQRHISSAWEGSQGRRPVEYEALHAPGAAAGESKLHTAPSATMPDGLPPGSGRGGTTDGKTSLTSRAARAYRSRIRDALSNAYQAELLAGASRPADPLPH